MSELLAAVAAARRSDPAAADAALGAAHTSAAGLSAYDRAFLGYLEGVALRELGRTSDAAAVFVRAMETAPATIGEALARRERANMLARLGPPSQTSS
ncbi:MAG TPA: hypothetical protein VE261_08375 [Gaiellaceae bacterium]|nr:hypothetical protein [Gaiellaceae bacterium]